MALQYGHCNCVINLGTAANSHYLLSITGSLPLFANVSANISMYFSLSWGSCCLFIVLMCVYV